MLSSYAIRTGKEGLHDITAAVREAIRRSGISAGLCVVYCPHTTAGITINENADPDVVRDLLYGLDKAFPDRPEFRHSEGNSAAHLKSSCIGSSVTLIVENGDPVLGAWQG
ncbi:MAG: secondary thiamine-phosphate synthase enzyme YjbQ, partial [Desulfovibrio sp.]|nr:secondary thiamine-phosphate synthase enzyme YjbQ [Desulfovibrio sp.]